MRYASSILRSGRRGYAMLVALVLIALITIIGATSLSVAGTDQRVATHNLRHMMVMNAADAGTEHARFALSTDNPANEGWDTASSTPFVDKPDADTMYEGVAFPMSQGVYSVNAVYQKCSNPPPGYSTELGRSAFRSDFWDMHSTAVFDDATWTEMNPTRAEVVATLRKVVHGPCKIR
jgi:type II secretory pathway component PulK